MEVHTTQRVNWQSPGAKSPGRKTPGDPGNSGPSMTNSTSGPMKMFTFSWKNGETTKLVVDFLMDTDTFLKNKEIVEYFFEKVTTTTTEHGNRRGFCVRSQKHWKSSKISTFYFVVFIFETFFTFFHFSSSIFQFFHVLLFPLFFICWDAENRKIVVKFHPTAKTKIFLRDNSKFALRWTWGQEWPS